MSSHALKMAEDKTGTNGKNNAAEIFWQFRV
jgi:hypothetical protein